MFTLRITAPLGRRLPSPPHKTPRQPRRLDNLCRTMPPGIQPQQTEPRHRSSPIHLHLDLHRQRNLLRAPPWKTRPRRHGHAQQTHLLQGNRRNHINPNTHLHCHRELQYIPPHETRFRA